MNEAGFIMIRKTVILGKLAIRSLTFILYKIIDRFPPVKENFLKELGPACKFQILIVDKYIS